MCISYVHGGEVRTRRGAVDHIPHREHGLVTRSGTVLYVPALSAVCLSIPHDTGPFTFAKQSQADIMPGTLNLIVLALATLAFALPPARLLERQVATTCPTSPAPYASAASCISSARRIRAICTAFPVVSTEVVTVTAYEQLQPQQCSQLTASRNPTITNTVTSYGTTITRPRTTVVTTS